MQRIKLADRQLPAYTKGEEIFHMVSHIVGGAFSIFALVMCIIVAALHKNPWGVVASCIYGVTMLTLYTISSIYHGLKSGTDKKVLQVIDHCTIYFMIAGSYMPFIFCTIREESTFVCWLIFVIEWGLVALATTLTAIDLEKTKAFSMICYIGMGWTIILFYKYLFANLEPTGIFLLVLSGVLYTVGAVIFSFKRKYAHSIFHIFIVLGSISHFLSVIFYVL